jgi:hypothetical protein
MRLPKRGPPPPEKSELNRKIARNASAIWKALENAVFDQLLTFKNGHLGEKLIKKIFKIYEVFRKFASFCQNLLFFDKKMTFLASFRHFLLFFVIFSYFSHFLLKFRIFHIFLQNT